MTHVGLERIILQFRIWIEGHLKMKAQTSEVTSLVPDAGFIHIYAKDDSGTTRLFYRDDAGAEHGPL